MVQGTRKCTAVYTTSYMHNTGNPDNPFNKPKINLGPAALAFRPAHECAAVAASPPTAAIDGAEQALQDALALYGGRFRGEPAS